MKDAQWHSLAYLLHSLTFRELKFSEPASQDRATLCVGTEAKGSIAPVEYPYEQAP
jgi:hypothetical protein